MFNSTTIGGGLGKTGSRLLAWGLGEITIVLPIGPLEFLIYAELAKRHFLGEKIGVKKI